MQPGRWWPIEEQDQKLWQTDDIAEAQDLLEKAIQQRQPGPFQIKAAIADCHIMRPKPDWRQMSLLYQSLWAFEPTSVIALNWAVVICEAGHAELALRKLNELRGDLHDFQPWHAAQAHILEKLGRPLEACSAYEDAILRAPNCASRKLLTRKLESLKSTHCGS